MAHAVVGPVATDGPGSHDRSTGGPVTWRHYGRPRGGVRRRAVPVVVSVAVVVTGLLYAFLWDPVVHHGQAWLEPSDAWGVYRAAHYVTWGYLGGVYNQETGMVTFPGIAVLLSPLVALGDVLRLTSSIGGLVVARPTATVLLAPVELVLATTVVFAADALAEELEVGRSARVGLCIAVGVLAWPTAAVWGHAEDALAMAFALWAMRSVLRAQWVAAGWLFGMGIVFQPLVAMAIPVFLAASPRGGRILFAARCSVVSAFLVGVAYLGNGAGTWRALVVQPTPPHFNHATPWISWAPHVRLAGSSTAVGVGLTHGAGTGGFVPVTAALRPLLQVSAGPGRTVYLVLAVLAGLYVWRRPPDPVRLLWLAGVVLAARCAFEAVMTPYYLAPPLFLLLVLASAAGRSPVPGRIGGRPGNLVVRLSAPGPVGLVAPRRGGDDPRGRPRPTAPPRHVVE